MVDNYGTPSGVRGVWVDMGRANAMSPEGYVLIAEMYANQEINVDAIIEQVRQTSGLNDFTIGVFRNGGHYRAYTTWYNPAWPGCCLHTVSATDGKDARKQAIRECKRAHRLDTKENMNGS